MMLSSRPCPITIINIINHSSSPNNLAWSLAVAAIPMSSPMYWSRHRQNRWIRIRYTHPPVSGKPASWQRGQIAFSYCNWNQNLWTNNKRCLWTLKKKSAQNGFTLASFSFLFVYFGMFKFLSGQILALTPSPVPELTFDSIPDGWAAINATP